MTTARAILRWVVGIFFVVAGANHFRDPATYLGMMPPWLPWPVVANFVSGVGEILGGVGLLLPATRRFSGRGLILLLLLVFPANLHVALQGYMPGRDFSPAVLWWRLPFQAVFCAVVWWLALANPPHSSRS